MAQKHRVKNPWQELAKVNAMPRTDVAQTAPRETLASYTRGYDAEVARQNEAAEQARFAGVRAAENALNETLQKARAQQAAALFNQESDELKSRCKNIVDDQFAEMSVEQCRQMIREAFDSFRTTLEETQGVRLEATALQKLQAISRKNLGIDLTDANVWWRLYDHANELGVFSDRDVTSIRVAAPSAQEQSSDPLAEMMNQPATREGERKARELANEHFFSTECREVYDRFLAHCASTWEFAPTEKQARAIVQWFQDTNRSMTVDRTAWDDMRRSLVLAGVLPGHMVTEDEVLAGRLENTNLNDRDARIEFARESRRING